MNQVVAVHFQLIAHDDVGTGAEASRQHRGSGRKLLRSHVIRRRVDQIARQRIGSGGAFGIFEIGLGWCDQRGTRSRRRDGAIA
jgi:hypothetical protein